MHEDYYYNHSYGYPCCGCGADCSGLGRCDDCKKDLCFLCFNVEDNPQGGAKVCDKCLDKRKPNYQQ